MTMYRQGDVLLVAVNRIPGGLVAVPRDNGRVILAYGEATGHAHAVRAVDDHAGLQTEPASRRTFLSLVKGGELVHEEHGTIALAPGYYEVIRQREYVGNGQAPVSVAD